MHSVAAVIRLSCVICIEYYMKFVKFFDNHSLFQISSKSIKTLSYLVESLNHRLDQSPAMLQVLVSYNFFNEISSVRFPGKVIDMFISDVLFSSVDQRLTRLRQCFH